MSDFSENPFEDKSQIKAEKKDVKQIAEITVDLLDKRYTDKNEKVLRGVHPKSHGCVKATFKINDDIPETYRVGLFTTPGKAYSAIIRFSNASVHVGPDLENKENASRGMAIKVLDIDKNEKILDKDHGKRNQDFLMINTPVFAFSNTTDYLRLNQILLKNNDDPTEFFAPLQNQASFPPEVVASTLETFKVISLIKSKPVANPLGVEYFGAAPFLFGENRVMRFSAMPAGGEQAQILPDPADENYLRSALLERMKQAEPVSFDFMVQVRGKDEADLGIEDATTQWDEEKYPFVKVASITISAPQLGIDSVESKAECENLVFTPWHSLKAHQPLGSINRLRRKVYDASSDHRGRGEEDKDDDDKDDDEKKKRNKDKDDRGKHKKEDD